MKPALVARSQRFLVGTALLFVLLAFFAYQTSTEHVDSVARTLQSVALLEKVQQLFSAVQDAETGQRGYLLTGRRDYLTPFLDARQELPSLFRDIDNLDTDGTIAHSQLNLLHQLANEKIRELEETLGLQDQGQHAAALALVETDRGRKTMSSIRALVYEVEATEQTAYGQRLERQRQRQRLLNTVLICSIVVALLFLFLAYRLSSRFAEERTKVEQQILTLNASLEQRVQSRTAELQQSAKELERRTRDLERSNADLTQFAYIASHDLQEPLRMVGSYMGLLDKRYGETLDDKARVYIQYALDGAARMQRLIHDLLQYSRAGTQALEKQSVPAESLVDAALKNLEVIIRETGAQVHYETLPVVEADPTKTTQVFQNLIGNAVKFRKPDVRPDVAIHAEMDGNAWKFSVADNGIGFDRAHEDRIFEIFQRLHGSGQYDGNGIGLSICRRIIENHGGRLWADSELGVGSTFYFTLPIGKKAV